MECEHTAVGDLVGPINADNLISVMQEGETIWGIIQKYALILLRSKNGSQTQVRRCKTLNEKNVTPSWSNANVVSGWPTVPSFQKNFSISRTIWRYLMREEQFGQVVFAIIHLKYSIISWKYPIILAFGLIKKLLFGI